MFEMSEHTAVLMAAPVCPHVKDKCHCRTMEGTDFGRKIKKDAVADSTVIRE
jgi:hypothetical protein